MKNFIYLLLIAVTLFSCEKEDLSINNDTTDVPVVQSYLEPGNSIKVKLTKMLPFVEGGNTGLESIDSATVYINHKGEDYLLSHIPNSLGEYESLDTNLQIIANDSYKIHFNYNDFVVSASTVIPVKPDNVLVSPTIYYIDPDATGPGSVTQDPVIVSWDNPDNSYYIVITEYLETDFNPINPNLEESTFESFRINSTDPINDNPINLTTIRTLVFFGNYRVIVYNINEEYVNLYENISQSTLNLTEPLTNIDNGLGIFTGINSDTLSLQVREL